MNQQVQLSSRPVHLYGIASFEDQLREAFNIADSRQHIQRVRSLLQQQLEIIRESNRHRGAGANTVRFITDMVNTLIRVSLDNLEISLKDSDKVVALVAVGSYGKKELCPKSDIDLLILTSEKITDSEKQQAESLIRSLWDYGFEVGSSVRSISQCETAISKDPETHTSFLSERFLGGNWNLYKEFLRILNKPMLPWKVNSLIKYKLNERLKRIDKFGGLVQHLEPNLKEGIGCMRDVHTILWVSQFKFGIKRLEDLVRIGLISVQDLDEINSANNYLLQARCCLHFIINKKDDLLDFHNQAAVAQEFGFRPEGNRKPVELFLQNYYFHTKAINRIAESVLIKIQPRSRIRKLRPIPDHHQHFMDLNGTLELKSSVGNPFRANPKLMLQYFEVANKTGLVFGSLALHRLKQSIRTMDHGQVDRKSLVGPFLKLCKRTQRVGRMLRFMHDVGLVQLIIPDFWIVNCHVQHNIYHIYTTDEHTLSVVRQLAYLKKTKEKNLESLRQSVLAVDDMDVLVLACFFHDIGKGIPGDHSVTGAEMIEKYMLEVGFPPDQAHEGAILVRHHLAMNEIAQRRNLEDPKVIQDFMEKIEKPATLHKLYILTYCDTSSVHPDAWSGWKSSLLRTLYYKTLDEFKKPLNQYIRASDLQDQLIEEASEFADRKLVFEHVKKMPRQYSSIATASQVVEHIKMLQQLKNHRLVLKRSDQQTHQKLSVVAPDHPQLLLAIFCATSQLNLSILNARIFTRMDGVVILESGVKFALNSQPDWGQIDERLHDQILKNIKSTPDELYEIFRAIRQPQIFVLEKGTHVSAGIDFSNTISENFSTIDVSCSDKLGLVFLVLKVFHDLDVIVHGAILTTEAGVALDAFYVTDMANRKIGNAKKIAQIKRRLEEELLGTKMPVK